MAAAPAGQFCWVDLAATDGARAIEFYAGLFGWIGRPQAVNGGAIVQLEHEGHAIGSLYQLNRSACDAGVRSHWTPYVRVQDIEVACNQAIALGGSVAVEPFAVDGMASIALIVDPVGASFGIWQEPAA